jgi:hypothetical protein
MQNVVGKFGLGQTTLCPAIFYVSKKVGMDMTEFATHIRNAIMMLFSDAKPSFGKWVILKYDSGPSRMTLDLLADLQLSGFILFPGVPNMMAITQESDQN